MAKINEILLVPHTHHDIGYTHVPTVCLESHEQGIYKALMLCEQDMDDTSPSAFHWTIEISRPLVKFLKRAASSDITRLTNLAARGRIAFTGGYLHMTQLIGTEEYARFFMPIRTMRQQYDLEVSVVQHGDINGVNWGSVPLMAEAGLDCLVMALNPDHGRAPFQQPSAFWWEGQDGSRVLAWLSIHYGLGGYPWALHDGRIEQAIDPVSAFISRLEERDDYPFDFLVVHIAFDNMLPYKQVSDSVEQWNRHGGLPTMRITTIDAAMTRARTQAALTGLATYRGEWADWWAHGHGSSAFEVAVSRQARANLRVAELSRVLESQVVRGGHTLSANSHLPHINWYGNENLLSGIQPWQSRVDAAYDNLLLFEEHTWGSFESITRPYSLFTQTHWNQKAGFTYDAESTAYDLNREANAALSRVLPHADRPALVVVNPTAYQRSDIVTVFSASDERTLFVQDIPPLGVKVVSWDEPARIRSSEPGTTLENAYYRIEADAGTASIVHLVDKQIGKDWVSSTALTGLGGVIYEQADSRDPHPAVHTHRRYFHPDTPGPTFIRTAAIGSGTASIEAFDYGSTLTMQSSAPYLPRIETAVTLYNSVPWIDLTVTVYKDANYRMEGVYVAFPFALQQPTFYLETANAVYRPDADQLPNTCRDWYSIQHGLGISNGEASILWATREAPLVQLARLRTGEWGTELDANEGHLYAWLMNNLYFTNFKAAQEGQVTFHFRFVTQPGPIGTSDVFRWGEAFGAPLFASVASVQAGTYDWIEASPESALITYVKPALERMDAFVLRLKETSGQPTHATLHWKGPTPIRLARINFLEEPTHRDIHGDGHTFEIALTPYEFVTLEVIPED